ncbi:copper chaperone PCu(A)C [Promicromonospora sp. MEB111]|uniref:copper chaperone PCu(A)C n=1 Tax=Promicromonospora sp. MEB111 TaxID=3040301 RepID=UPI00254C1A26|nr:copper chaperone PCu(A)C [Promicromonospora sp. MEB111]
MNNRPTGRRGRSTTAGLGVVLTALALAGCATADAADDDGGSAARAAQGVTLSDAWVKAADSGMSAAFGGLTNSGAQDVTVVSATTEASSMLELHETVENETGELVMREIDGGFVIPAGDTLTLEPGGSHIMLMDLTDPLEAGDEVTFTLTFSDDSTYEFTAPVKDYSGANENYVGGDTGADAGDMDMGSGTDTDDAGHTGTDG